MRELDLDLEMRPATMDDAEIVAGLETAREPEDPRDPAMLRFWWSSRAADEAHTKMVAERNGEAFAYVAAGHDPWEPKATRFGWIRPILHPELWSETRYETLVAAAESWLREEQASIAVAHLREMFQDQLKVLERRGYSEVRRSRISERASAF